MLDETAGLPGVKLSRAKNLGELSFVTRGTSDVLFGMIATIKLDDS